MSEQVVIVDLSARAGGTQRRIIELVRRWPSAAPAPTVVMLAGSRLSASLDSTRHTAIELERRRWDPRVLIDLIGVFRSERASVVDAHNVAAQFWAVLGARLARVSKVVCTVHSNYEQEYANTPRARLYTLVLRMSSWLGATFVAVAPGVADWLERLGISSRRVVVVRNALPSRGDRTSDRATTRAELGVRDSSFVIVCVARLEEVKRIDDLIKTMPILVDQGVDAQLLLIGDGGQIGSLRSLVEQCGLTQRVRFLGERDDVFDMLGAADCFAMLSATEGLPFAPLEATLLQLPLVLTRVGELPTLLGEDAARFVSVGDPTEAADALAELAMSAQARKSLGALAAMRASSALPADELAPATLAAYGVLQAGGPVRGAAAALWSNALCRRAVSATVPLSRSLLPQGPTLSVLTYHRVAEPGSDCLDPTLVSATPTEFDEQMRLLRSRYEPVDSQSVVAAIMGDAPLPPNAVHVTFDDGYRDVHRHAVPILERYSIPATLFVPTDYPDQPDREFWWDRLYRALARTNRRLCVTPAGTFPLDGRPSAAEAASRSIARYVKTLPHADAMAIIDEVVSDLGGTDVVNAVLGWGELGILPSSGVQVASHTRSHAALDGLPFEALEDELVGSKHDLEHHLGACPPLFAYPTGQSDARVRREVSAAGYVAAFGTGAGINRLPVDDPLLLRRVDVSRKVDAHLLNVLLSPAGRPLNRLR